MLAPKNEESQVHQFIGSRSSGVERVFPIRIQVPSKQPPILGPGTNIPQDIPTSDASQSIGDAEAQPILPQNDGQSNSLGASVPLASTIQISEPSMPGPERHVTNRFNYIPANTESSANALGTQRIYRCEDEPIHIPGAVQAFGALIAIRESDNGLFLVRVASENTKRITGISPEDLFELRCFTDILSQVDRKEFVIRFRALDANKTKTNPDVFMISLISLVGQPVPLFCAMHLSAESKLMICEFELQDDLFNTIHPPNEGLPEKPLQIIGHEATEEDRLMSTTSRSTPLHALEVARLSLRQLGPMDLFDVLSEIQWQLGAAETLSGLLDVAVGLVYELTSFHRVMAYQFDETAAGCVVSEIVDPRASADIYRGLNFPASDIPKQARDLYLINTIRILYDRSQETARLVCRDFDDIRTPLNLKHSYLRAMSPIHLKYLANMGVDASMSISLIVDDKLWGLISCHNYGSGMRVSLPVRELCRVLGNVASSNIDKLIQTARIKARKALSSPPTTSTPSAYIAASSADLLEMFGADFGFLVIKGEARTIGKLIAYGECIALLQYVRQQAFVHIFTSHAISKDCEGLAHPAGFHAIAGLLVIPLAMSGADFLVFFRKGKEREIKWAGNPHEKTGNLTTSYLEPRSSFKRWTENVMGTSREWTEDQIESAGILSILYGRFIEVWRQKEAIVQKNRMTRLLIRNAGHEVRTPLNVIINYLEIALEETLDERARQHLQRSLESSKSLVFAVNDLLNLAQAEDYDFNVNEDNVDLKAMISDLINVFETESARRGLKLILEDDTAVPKLVRCDPTGIRQVISNLLANAIQNSDTGNVQIGLEHISSSEASTLIEISIKDDGSGLSEEQLDSIFQDFEQILDEEESNHSESPKGDQKPVRPLEIGLGLAITARFVRLNYGQISISSEGKGKGTRVAINIPFRKALPGSFPKSSPKVETVLPTPPTETETTIAVNFSDLAISTALSKSDPISLSLPLNKSFQSLESALNQYPFPKTPTITPEQKLNVLIAEDNPLNSRLLETRLVKKGHIVKLTVDGQACTDTFKASPEEFDIILMDIQMPLVDGAKATRLIREFEVMSSPRIAQRAASYGRVPIIAVSASLSEQRKDEYVDIGFDGWILKPIDFKRLETILSAMQDEELREQLLYSRGSWETGGWFNTKTHVPKVPSPYSGIFDWPVPIREMTRNVASNEESLQ